MTKQETKELSLKDVNTYLSRWQTQSLISLADFPKKFQKIIKEKYGIPEIIDARFIIGMGGKPYTQKAGRQDALFKKASLEKKSIKIIEELVAIKPCKEMGCVSQTQDGWIVKEPGTEFDGRIIKAQEEIKEVYKTFWQQYQRKPKLYKNIIETQPQDFEKTFIVKCKIEVGDQIFEALGDACPHNTTSTVRNSLIRMASTRAFNRASGQYIQDTTCSWEEIPEQEIIEARVEINNNQQEPIPNINEARGVKKEESNKNE